MTKLNKEEIEDYQIRKPFKTGGSSVAIILTGLVNLDTKYICWKNKSTGNITIEEFEDKKDNKTKKENK